MVISSHITFDYNHLNILTIKSRTKRTTTNQVIQRTSQPAIELERELENEREPELLLPCSLKRKDPQLNETYAYIRLTRTQ
jgi:hypothetical protein